MGAPKDPIKREEWIQKRADANRGKKRTPEQIARMSAIMMGHEGPKKGIPRSEETKAKISASLTGKPGPWLGKKRPDIGPVLADANRGRAPWNKGLHGQQVAWNKGATKKNPEELQKQISRKGRNLSEETKEKIRQKNLNRTPEQKAKHLQAQRARWANATEEQRAQWSSHLANSAKNKKDSSIELFVAGKLTAQESVFERQKRIGNYWVDFYIPATNTVIEVNGCYWHGCERCGYNSPEHIEKRAKDAKRYERLRSKGYTVEVLWEHDLRIEMN